jgi:hypothetical protein
MLEALYTVFFPLRDCGFPQCIERGWRTEKGFNCLAQVETLVRSNAKWVKSVNNKE